MARRQLIVNEKTWIIKHRYRLEYSINIERLWCKDMNKNPPHRDAIRIPMKKFKPTGDENFYKNTVKPFVNILVNPLQVINLY